MRLATIRLADGSTEAARVDGESAVLLGHPDVGALLRDGGLGAAARAVEGATVPLAGADLAPVVPTPGKILCVGLNYRNHILEMGRDLPEFPTLFAKYPEALIGARDAIRLPAETEKLDWEGELAIVIGSAVRRAGPTEARAAIAGYAVLNDITARDWQYRSPQWLQGKTFEATTPFGPQLVTPDEWQPGADLITLVNGEEVQRAGTGDLVFDPAELVAYASTILTLRPGDVIATGTPGGVGHARKPPRYLGDGQTVTTTIEGLGTLTNLVLADGR
ncbi:fumarylacetoacetate hydrolase family protein [Streptomyces sp. B6B3]|uniref:fumarylacetoacetate hydrolase family protein n=1 Tax=Streptomyces sp. B6B3 TaxID=3153570 RepID=UPI00325D0E56